MSPWAGAGAVEAYGEVDAVGLLPWEAESLGFGDDGPPVSDALGEADEVGELRLLRRTRRRQGGWA